MRKILTTILLTIFAFVNYAQNQSYDEAARNCTFTFQDGLDKIPADSVDKVVGERLANLRECFIGLKFPNFTLTSIDGTQYKLSDLRGKVILLNFWFIACSPCVAEMPLLNELVEEYRGQEFLLLTFSLDDKESILNFKKKRNLNFAIFDKSDKLIENDFQLSYGYPINIFIDKNGIIADFKVGGVLSEDKLRVIKTEFKATIDRELRR